MSNILELNGLLVSTIVPSEARLKFRFTIGWDDVDINELRDKLSKITNRFTIEVNKTKRQYVISLLVFEQALSELRKIRSFYFDMLHKHTIIIQSIEEEIGRRNLYLLPLENLEKFMADWKTIEEGIKKINKMIKIEAHNPFSVFSRIIFTLNKMGLHDVAKRLSEKATEDGWKLPKPQLRLQRFLFKYEEIEPYIKSEKVKEEIKKVLEDQYRRQLEEIVKSIARQVEEIVKPLAQEKSEKMIEKTKERLDNLIAKTKSLGLQKIAEKIEEIRDTLGRAEVKAEELAIKMIEEMELELT